jgi:acyl-CoA thioester hydrolase
MANPAMTVTHAPFHWPVRVYWEDTDAGGIVFYANYLKFFERARTEWLRSLGVDQSALMAEQQGFFVVSDTQLKYHAPAKLDDALIVTAQLSVLGSASMTITQQCLLGEQCIVDGSIRIGWVARASDAQTAERFKPSRIPKVILDKLRI